VAPSILQVSQLVILLQVRILPMADKLTLATVTLAKAINIHHIRTGYASYYTAHFQCVQLQINRSLRFDFSHKVFLAGRIVNSAATLLFGNSQDCVPKIPKLILKFPR